MKIVVRTDCNSDDFVNLRDWVPTYEQALQLEYYKILNHHGHCFAEPPKKVEEKAYKHLYETEGYWMTKNT